MRILNFYPYLFCPYKRKNRDNGMVIHVGSDLCKMCGANKLTIHIGKLRVAFCNYRRNYVNYLLRRQAIKLDLFYNNKDKKQNHEKGREKTTRTDN